MGKIHIVTDCTCDLTDELIEKYNIRVFPLYVTFGSETYYSEKELNTVQLFEKIKETGQMPKTAAVSPGFYHSLMEEYSADDDVIYTGIGGGFSGNFSNALKVREEHPNFYPIDSKNLSSGIGLLVIKLAQLRDAGLSAKEIEEKAKEIREKIRVQFAIDTLEYLHKGGRCSATVRLIGTLLKIKPVVRVVDGKMEVTKKPLGLFKKALDAVLEYFDEDLKNIDTEYVFITHPMAEKDETYLKDEILKRDIKIKNLLATTASSVIASHCGPRTIGIIYALK